ncbi:reverse transcriptase domain-containing protein [Bradyrhizobium sp. LB12.1]|uniref:reverse transcriptase domain-containing protein n=1 Tax=Bradyrhizobium sp. LB12.1 TaxID=3156327 RepID=UPI00339A2C0A
MQLVRRWSKEAAREHRCGRKRVARQYQTRLFESLASRFVAACQAEWKVRRRERQQQRASGRAPASVPVNFARVWRIAERLGDPRAPASVVILTEPKKSGGFRLVCSPDEFGVAKQMLFVNAVKPFASLHPSQFALRRGWSAACKSLWQTMNEPHMQNTRFVQFDVVDFFGSISREYVEEAIPAPKAVIHSTLFMDSWRMTFKGIGSTTDRRGLPQGLAASSLVAEMVMADVLREIADLFPELRCIHAYSDNWGGFVPHDQNAGDLVESLKHAFETHRAGPYRLTDRTRLAEQSFEFLGLYFKPATAGRRARVSLPSRVSRWKELEFTAQLIEASTANDVLRVLDRLRSFSSTYRLAPETDKLGRRICRLAIRELESQRAYRGRRRERS